MESKVSLGDTEEVLEPCTIIIDAMALIQKIHGENRTFIELAKYVLSAVVHAATRCQRIDVVFNVYKQQSIKSAERKSRGSREGITFNEIMPGHQIQIGEDCLQVQKLKQTNQVFCRHWKDKKVRENIGDKTLFVTYREQCFQINSDSCVEIDALRSNQEEVDTRLLLHAKHAEETYPSIICVSNDTDVLIICLGLMAYISSKIFIRRGKRSCNRLVDVKRLASAVELKVCTELIGLHP